MVDDRVRHLTSMYINKMYLVEDLGSCVDLRGLEKGSWVVAPIAKQQYVRGTVGDVKYRHVIYAGGAEDS